MVQWTPVRVEVHIPDPATATTPRLRAEGLSALNEWAVHNLWANRPGDSSSANAWSRSHDEWRHRVVEWMKISGCDPIDVTAVSVLGDIPVIGGADDPLSHQLSMLQVRRQRIAAVVESYRSDSAPQVDNIEKR